METDQKPKLSPDTVTCHFQTVLTIGFRLWRFRLRPSKSVQWLVTSAFRKVSWDRFPDVERATLKLGTTLLHAIIALLLATFAQIVVRDVVGSGEQVTSATERLLGIYEHSTWPTVGQEQQEPRLHTSGVSRQRSMVADDRRSEADLWSDGVVNCAMH